jgi:TPR repeat protein
MSYREPIRHVQSFSYEQQWQRQPAAKLSVPLERTAEPVWPEDEEAEAAELGRAFVPFMEDDEADSVLENITVALPDRLIPTLAQDLDPSHKPFGQSASNVTRSLRESLPDDYDYVAFHIPTSYSAHESLILRRLRLDVVLSGNGHVLPIVILMRPGTGVDVSVNKIGELSVDLGRVVSTLLPYLPPVFTANVGAQIERTNVNPKVQASGLQKRKCSWRVADSRIAYDFNPALIALFSEDLTVAASLHIEVRKRVLGVFHRTYGKSATPTWYKYRPGQFLMTAFDYVEYSKGIGSDKELYEDRISGSRAFYQLGKNLENQDLPKAKIWYRRAADAGNIAAMLRLAEWSEEREPAEAEKWYRRAAKAGHTDALIKLGDLKRRHDPVRARVWYLQAADIGGTPIMFRLGTQFEQSDPAEARLWYMKAADAGNVAAMLRLGHLLENWDPAEARLWYTRAADAGDVTAMLRLGRLAENWDPAEAGAWYTQAADAGDSRAMLRLGELEEKKRHRRAADFWYRKAANAGSYKAQQALVRIRPWRYFFMRYRHLRVSGVEPAIRELARRRA